MSIKQNTILQDCFNKYEISKAQENCDLDFDCDIQCLSFTAMKSIFTFPPECR